MGGVVRAVGNIFGGGGGGGGGSAPAPAPSAQTITQSTIPEYARPYVETMLGKAQALTDVNQNPYQAYGGERIAGFSPMQQQAFFQASQQTPAGQLAPATQLATMAGEQALGSQARADLLGQQALGYGAAGAEYGGLGAQQALARSQQAARQASMYGGLGAGFGARAAGLAPQAQAAGLEAANIGMGGLGLGALGTGYGARGALAAEQGFGAGEQYARMATSPEAMGAYMSPYMQQAVDRQKFEATRDYAKQLQNLKAQAVGQGAFGGSRQAIVESEAQRNLNQQLQNIQAAGTQRAFEQAQQAQQFGAGLGLQGLQAGYGGLGLGMQGAGMGLQGIGTALQGQRERLASLGQAGQLYGQGIQGAGLGLQGVGQQLGAGQLGLAGTGQGIAGAQAGLQGVQGALGAGQYGLAGLGAATGAAGTLGQLGQTQFGQEQAINAELQKIGAIQQAQAQQGLDLAYQDFLKQRNYPYQQMAFMSDMLRGLPLSQTAQTMYAAPPSLGSQLGGLGMAGLGIYGMSGGFRAKGGAIKEKKMAAGGYATGGDIKMLSTEQLEKLLESPNLSPMEQAMVEEQLMLRRRMEMNPEADTIMRGVAAIPTGNMVPMEETMAGGGIVAFAKGNSVKDTSAEYEKMLMEDIKRRQKMMETGDPYADSRAREAKMEAEIKNIRETAPYRALAAAGLGTLAGTSQYGLSNLGLGGIEGLKTYGQAKREEDQMEKLLLQQAGEREKSKFARESALLGSQQTTLGQLLGRRSAAETAAASRADTATRNKQLDLTRAQNAYKDLFNNAFDELSRTSKPGGINYKKYKDNPDQLKADARSIALGELSPDLRNLLGFQMPAATTAPAAAPAKGVRTPPAPAIVELKKNDTPQTRAQFDAIFGAGAAQRALGK